VGPLILFSGIDGAGKTTQIARVEAALSARGQHPRRVWARGGYTPLFSLAKRVLRSLPGRAIPPPGRSERRQQALRQGWVRTLWLQVAIFDLMIYYGLWVRWLRLRGNVVLSDRYLDDTALDFALNYPESEVTRWLSWRMLWRVAPRPTAAFMFLIPAAESLRRSRQKDEPFPDSEQTLARRLEAYETICASGVWQRIDGLQDREVITRQLLAAIDAADVSSSR
jgi:thymidylate kinase